MLYAYLCELTPDEDGGFVVTFAQSGRNTPRLHSPSNSRSQAGGKTPPLHFFRNVTSRPMKELLFASCRTIPMSPTSLGVLTDR